MAGYFPFTKPKALILWVGRFGGGGLDEAAPVPASPPDMEDRQRRTPPLGARVGGVVSTAGGLMVVTQYRLLLVSLRVLVGKDTPGGGSGVVVGGVPHPASLRVERRSGPGNLGPFPPT